MLLIIWYMGLLAAGDVLAYFAGLRGRASMALVPSMIVFLAIYFVTLWVAWVIAVWLTEPKRLQLSPPLAIARPEEKEGFSMPALMSHMEDKDEAFCSRRFGRRFSRGSGFFWLSSDG